MNNILFLKKQTLELERLLSTSSKNQVLRLQLESRLDDARKALQNEIDSSKVPGELFSSDYSATARAAIFLRGKGVKDSSGIRPSLAGEALIQYERMYVEQAIHEERLAAQRAGRSRRPRGASKPSLMFCGTPRGSFGLEFYPLNEPDSSLATIHDETLAKLAETITKISTDTEAAFGDVPPRVLQPLKQFLKVLSENDAELRFAFTNAASDNTYINSNQIKSASDRLQREVSEIQLTFEGTFRGLTLESGAFDLVTDSGTITGKVDDTLTEEDLQRIVLLINQPCSADILKTTVTSISGTHTDSYLLLDAKASR